MVEHIHPDLPPVCRPHILREDAPRDGALHLMHAQQYHALVNLEARRGDAVVWNSSPRNDAQRLE